MKWYSVKKYVPPDDCKLFVITDYGDIWTCKYTAEHLDEYDGALFISDMDGMIVKGITHFCIPDPIEIEE
jgi:hypothetical protein